MPQKGPPIRLFFFSFFFFFFLPYMFVGVVAPTQMLELFNTLLHGAA